MAQFKYFITDMSNDSHGMATICEVNYLDDNGKDIGNTILARATDDYRCEYSNWCVYRDDPNGISSDGVYLDYWHFNTEYITKMLTHDGKYYDISRIALTFRKVPSWQLCIVNKIVPDYFGAETTTERVELMNEAQIALAIDYAGYLDNCDDLAYWLFACDEIYHNPEKIKTEEELDETWEEVQRWANLYKGGAF